MAHALIGLFLLTFWTVSALSAPQVSSPTAVIGQYMGCGVIAGKIPKTDASGIAQCSDDTGAGSGAPTTSTYLTQVCDGTLTAEQCLSVLASGLMFSTTTTGVVSIYAGSATGANQLFRSLNGAGVVTSTAMAAADVTAGIITNSHINPAAAIAESKLALTFATHSPANDPTVNEKAALAGTSGTAPSVSNKFVDNADTRLPSMTTPAALSAASQITCDRPTQLITGSGGAVTLNNAAWLVNGTYSGQTCELQNASTTNTVTGPTTATIINCGGLGSVVIGKNHATPTYKWTGTLWQRQGCISLQGALNSGAKLMGGLTTAAPLQLRGGTADAPSTTGFDLYDDGAGNPIIQGVSSGGAADSVRSVPATKNEIVLLNGVETERTTVAGVHTYTGIGQPRGTLWWDAAALKPDGTHCVAVSPTVNSGPVIDGITCAENAAAKLSAKVRLPDRYVGGTLFCRLVVHDVDTLGHVSGWDARGQCRTPGTDAINATWGTAVAMDVTMTTAFIPYANTEATITPNGTCVGGDMLFLELNMDTTANTDDGDAVIEGMTCEYLQGSRGD